MRSFPKKVKFFSLPTVSICLLLAVWLAFNLKAKQESFESLINLTPNAQNGQYVFNASGCSSFHRDPHSKNRLLLSGGLVLTTHFGEFYVPSISMITKNGIGAWSFNEFC